MIQRKECGCGFSEENWNEQTNKQNTFKPTFPRIGNTERGVLYDKIEIVISARAIWSYCSTRLTPIIIYLQV